MNKIRKTSPLLHPHHHLPSFPITTFTVDPSKHLVEHHNPLAQHRSKQNNKTYTEQKYEPQVEALAKVAGRVVTSRSQMVIDEQRRDANPMTDGAAETFCLKEGSGADDGGSHERGRQGEGNQLSTRVSG
ncbi:NACHT, LRR and PYD domain-containing protein [Sesbania bispinosa]|nr:NACHT, LRR and PYD domain-containing protein [Sesbania bispinosa]